MCCNDTWCMTLLSLKQKMGSVTLMDPEVFESLKMETGMPLHLFPRLGQCSPVMWTPHTSTELEAEKVHSNPAWTSASPPPVDLCQQEQLSISSGFQMTGQFHQTGSHFCFRVTQTKQMTVCMQHILANTVKKIITGQKLRRGKANKPKCFPLNTFLYLYCICAKS